MIYDAFLWESYFLFFIFYLNNNNNNNRSCGLIQYQNKTQSESGKVGKYFLLGFDYNNEPENAHVALLELGEGG